MSTSIITYNKNPVWIKLDLEQVNWIEMVLRDMAYYQQKELDKATDPEDVEFLTSAIQDNKELADHIYTRIHRSWFYRIKRWFNNK